MPDNRAHAAARPTPPAITAREAPVAVEQLLAAVAQSGASDVHLQPTAAGLEIRWRIDGVLEPWQVLAPGLAPSVVARLKVLAGLLTYRSDLPQEGRLRSSAVVETPHAYGEIRVSTFPTLYGEKVVLRVLGGGTAPTELAELGLPGELAERLERLLDETAGALLVVGPAGAGKTTTLYACLRRLARSAAGGRHLATLEDPIEVPLAGVSQSQLDSAAGFDLATGLKHLLRQDPEVLLLSELRERATAELVLQTALSGHLLLTSFHAPDAATAIARLIEMGIEPFLVRAAVLGVLAQRLVRRLCDCAIWTDEPSGRLQLPIARYRLPVGCDACRHTGYRGRRLLAELLTLDQPAVSQAVLHRADVASLAEQGRSGGLVTLAEQALAAIGAGDTSPAEIRRVLGWNLPLPAPKGPSQPE